uniref:Uncharacterized protein n=1 Tax=Chloropicon laureae TaxID=464258 RepID=A0A7S2Z485_9CHLO
MVRRIGSVSALGLIGDARAPLNAVLGKAFGFFPTEYRLRGVPRHGGAIVEAYDTDQFRKMSPLQRHEAAEAVSAAIADGICRWYNRDRAASGNSGKDGRHWASSEVLAGCSATGCPVDESYVQRNGIRAKTY